MALAAVTLLPTPAGDGWRCEQDPRMLRDPATVASLLWRHEDGVYVYLSALVQRDDPYRLSFHVGRSGAPCHHSDLDWVVSEFELEEFIH